MMYNTGEDDRKMFFRKGRQFINNTTLKVNIQTLAQQGYALYKGSQQVRQGVGRSRKSLLRVLNACAKQSAH